MTRKLKLTSLAILLSTVLTALEGHAQITAGNIEKMTGWLTCATCGGRIGSTSAAPDTMTQRISSPSLDGNSAKFWLGGKTPYSDVIWWKDLGGKQASNFSYDLY